MGRNGPATATLVGALSALLVVADGGASTSIAVPFDSLVRESSAVAFVTPMRQTALWENDRIVTYTDVHVDEQLAGEPLGDEVWVRTLGGEVGNLGQSVSGEAVFTVGRPTLVFVREAYVLGADVDDARTTASGAFTVAERAQGQFPVVLDRENELRLHRSSAVGATLPPRGGAPAVMAEELLHGMRVRDVAATVSTAWKRIRGG